MSQYKSTKTGNTLVRKPAMFCWRGKLFHGLVDEEVNALYADPGDDFIAATGTGNALDGGRIEEVEE